MSTLCCLQGEDQRSGSDVPMGTGGYGMSLVLSPGAQEPNTLVSEGVKGWTSQPRGKTHQFCCCWGFLFVLFWLLVLVLVLVYHLGLHMIRWDFSTGSLLYSDHQPTFWLLPEALIYTKSKVYSTVLVSLALLCWHYSNRDSSSHWESSASLADLRNEGLRTTPFLCFGRSLSVGCSLFRWIL